MSDHHDDGTQMHDREAGAGVPAHRRHIWSGRRSAYCLVIPVINEGQRLHSLLRKITAATVTQPLDIIIADGGSTDGSLEPADLTALGVRALLVKEDAGKLSAQLRMAYAFALEEAYAGVITIDGNDKDDPGTLPDFIQGLEEGWDFLQASRYIEGGLAVNTPKLRDLAIRCIHAPLLSLASGFHWTDTTQGYRGYSARLLSSDALAIFRPVFQSYELLAYLSYRAPKIGMRCRELPTARIYPQGEVPTKISAWRGNWEVLRTLLAVCAGRFNPA